VGREKEVELLRIEMWCELTRLRDEIEQQREVTSEAVGTVIGEYSDKIVDRAEKMVKEIRDMLTVSIERRFGELAGRIDAALPDHRARSTAREFRFSSERDDVDIVNDLPSPREIVRKTKMN
jgi:hypothetical protein